MSLRAILIVMPVVTAAASFAYVKWERNSALAELTAYSVRLHKAAYGGSVLGAHIECVEFPPFGEVNRDYSAALDILPRLPTLEVVRYHGHIDENGILALSRISHLRKLDISHSYAFPSIAVSSAAKFKRLEEVDVTNFHGNADLFLVALVRNAPRLHTIRLGAKGVSWRGLAHLADSPLRDQIRSLDVCNRQLTHDWFQQLSRFDRLEELNLSHHCFTDETIPSLVAESKLTGDARTRLEKLLNGFLAATPKAGLDICECSSEAYSNLFQSARFKQTLVTLKLHGVEFIDANVLTSLRDYPRLRSFELVEAQATGGNETSGNKSPHLN